MRTKKEGIAWLHKFGYLRTTSPSSSEYDEALKAMQKRYGLKPDALLGPITSRSMGMFRCARPDIMQLQVAGSSDCMWEKRDLRYYSLANFKLHLLTVKQTVAIMDAAFAAWTKHVPLTFKRATTAREADILIGASKAAKYGFDGIGNVLAWAYMPCGDVDEQLEMMFDQAEPWTDKQGAAGIYALAVAAHEIGHIIGLDHSQNDGDLMAPYYNPSVWTPQKGDVTRIQHIYGKVSAPVPGGPGAAPESAEVSGTVTVSDYGLVLDLKYA